MACIVPEMTSMVGQKISDTPTVLAIIYVQCEQQHMKTLPIQANIHFLAYSYIVSEYVIKA